MQLIDHVRSLIIDLERYGLYHHMAYLSLQLCHECQQDIARSIHALSGGAAVSENASVTMFSGFHICLVTPEHCFGCHVTSQG